MPLSRQLLIAPIVSLATLVLTTGCTLHGPAGGGAQAVYNGQRSVNPADIWLPPGYKIQAVIQGLNFPTGVTFDDKGGVYVTESGYSYGEVWDIPLLIRIERDGGTAVIAEGDN